mgnify:CR=1 FL=1
MRRRPTRSQAFSIFPLQGACSWDGSLPQQVSGGFPGGLGRSVKREGAKRVDCEGRGLPLPGPSRRGGAGLRRVELLEGEWGRLRRLDSGARFRPAGRPGRGEFFRIPGKLVLVLGGLIRLERRRRKAGERERLAFARAGRRARGASFGRREFCGRGRESFPRFRRPSRRGSRGGNTIPAAAVRGYGRPHGGVVPF